MLHPRPSETRYRHHRRGDHRYCSDPAACRAADLWRMIRRHCPEASALVELAGGTNCTDWPTLYDLAVELVGPAAYGADPAVRSFACFDVLHDWLWSACRGCSSRDCIRCRPGFASGIYRTWKDAA